MDQSSNKVEHKLKQNTRSNYKSERKFNQASIPSSN